jgi:hypothetical protein
MKQKYIIVDKRKLGEMQQSIFDLTELVKELKSEIEEIKRGQYKSDYITEEDLAKEWDMTKRFISTLRMQGKIAFHKFPGKNGRVIYARKDVESYLNAIKAGKPMTF